MSVNQMDLFEVCELPKESTNYLFIVKDNARVDMKIELIFDPAAFDELYAITYVSSPLFFSKHTKHFNKVTFILGINDNSNLEQFANAMAARSFLNVDDRMEFWNGLDVESKEKIINKRLDIRYGQTDIIIHDKIYLLRDSKTNRKRVIIGSANLTSSAFSDNKQFENIRIDDDNEELFNLYMNRFDEIYAKTMDYIPDRCIREYKKENVVLVKDGELSQEVLIDEIIKNNTKIIIEEKHIEEIKELAANIQFQKQDIDKTDRILSLITHNSKGEYKLKTPVQLQKQTVAIKTAFCKTNKSSQEVDERIFFTYYDKDNTIKRSMGNTNELNTLSESATKEIIKANLIKINKFIEAYKIFALNPNIENQSKVFEVILYTFMSPYIWKIREHHVLQKGLESVRADFQPFLIVGGVPKSGKTTALEFASLLLGNNGKRYFKYAKEVATAGILFDFFNSENLYPILVDEIEQSFFHRNASPRKGEGFIKYVTNDLASKHPVMIGTTNKRDFSSSTQVLRRIYYLEINNVFDDERKSESMEFLDTVLSDIDNSLFKDFTYRMGLCIKNNEPFYKIDDVLFRARQVFKDYYEECQMELPEWFPHKRFKDYEIRKVNMWKTTFNAHRQHFIEKDDGILYVYLDEICKNNKDRRSQEQLLNFIDDTCIKENGTVLELHKDKFFEFIDYKENPSIVQKLGRMFKR